MKVYKFLPLVLFTPICAFAQLSQSHFDSCLNGLRSSFASKGVSVATFDAYRPAMPDESVIKSLNYQPEFKSEVWDYLAMLVDNERVADGMNAKQAHLNTLYQVEQRYGVDMYAVLGVWGVESNFGKTLGKKPLFDSLATLSCFDRRQSYFRGEFANALKIVQNGHIRAQDMTGSWAGAFGQTQFMPSTFLELSVDFDGDGRKDIVNSVSDALASTANFLAKRGYRSGEVWGFEVKKPAGQWVSSNRKDKKAISYWRNLGYTLPDGSPLPNTLSSAGILAPAGSDGPIFLVGKNFDVFYSYNASESYALAIAHLGDSIKKQAQDVAFSTAWPTDDAGISRQQAREIQEMLNAQGYHVGAVDGIIGEGTRVAIRQYQQAQGVAPDGRAGQKLYRLMKSHQNNGNSQYPLSPSTPNNSVYYNIAPSTSPSQTTNSAHSSFSRGQVWQSTPAAGVQHSAPIRYRVVTTTDGQKILVPDN